MGCPSTDLDQAIALEAQGHDHEAALRYIALAKSDPANLAAWDHAIDLVCLRDTRVGECMGVLDLELHLLGHVERHTQALARVLEARAQARLEQGLLEAALQDLDRAERAAPSRASLFITRARVLARKHQPEKARAALDRARELKANSQEIDAILPTLKDAFDKNAPDDGHFGGL